MLYGVLSNLQGPGNIFHVSLLLEQILNPTLLINSVESVHGEKETRQLKSKSYEVVRLYACRWLLHSVPRNTQEYTMTAF